jgi:ATP synthase F1 delta subunit
MSIVVSKVAEPYAEALIDLAKSNDSLKETTNDMNIVSQFLANSSDLKKFLGNPLITKAAKKECFKGYLRRANRRKYIKIFIATCRSWSYRRSGWYCSKVP